MKRGFTLIELLAVIVILAIIALIATPIVLNIINDARESSTLRSADFYLDAVEYTIANEVLYEGGLPDGEYPITTDGNLCKVPLDKNACPDGKILKVEVNGEKPSSGSIIIENGNIKDIVIELNDKTIVKNEKGELDYYKSPCTLISGDKNTPGSKYKCEVKSETTYNFYVLSQNSDGTTNLIMDRNIYYDSIADVGVEATSTNTGLIKWYENSADSSYGPVTAMDYLHNSTKDWSSIPNIVMNYTDNNYGGLKTTNNITKITKKDGTITASYNNLKARMPFAEELDSYDSTTKENAYLYDNLNLTCYDDNRNVVDCSIATEIFGVIADGINNINGIYGYWVSSSYETQSAYIVYSSMGIVYFSNVNEASGGVRPVITVKL